MSGRAAGGDRRGVEFWTYQAAGASWESWDANP